MLYGRLTGDPAAGRGFLVGSRWRPGGEAQAVEAHAHSRNVRTRSTQSYRPRYASRSLGDTYGGAMRQSFLTLRTEIQFKTGRRGFVMSPQQCTRSL